MADENICTYDGLRVYSYRVALEIKPPEEKSKGGIVLTQDRLRKDQDMVTRGYLRAMGEEAFEDLIMRPKIGDYLGFVKFAGIELKHRGKFYRIINDKDVIFNLLDGEEDDTE